MTKRPLKEWLDELPAPYREEAMFNTRRHMARNKLPECFLNSPSPALAHALSSAFDWTESKEGKMYWISFYDTLPRQTLNPPQGQQALF